MNRTAALDLAEPVGAVHEPPVLDRHAHPDVRVPVELGRELGEPVVALRQDLEGVPVGLAHHVEHVLDVVVGDRLVEEVGHRVDEDHARAVRHRSGSSSRSGQSFRSNPCSYG